MTDAPRPDATLTRPDGTAAELRGSRWASEDGPWAELLNEGFDPALSSASVGGLPAYTATVARAAEHFGCEAKYPWSDTPPRADVVH